MDLDHLLQDRCRSAGVAETPAGHRISLGKTVDQNGPVAHARDLGDGRGVLPRVGQLRIDLIGDDIEVILDDDFRDRLQFLPGHDRTGRIVREGQDQHLGLRRDFCPEILRHQLEAVLLLQFQDHRDAVSEDNAGLVGHIAGLRDDDLVPGIQHGAEGKVDSFGTADRDRDLGIRIVGNAETALQIPRDLRLQLKETGVAGIEGPSALQRIDTLFPDGPGRVEIRLADTQGDGVLHGADNVKKLPDPGGADRHRFTGKLFVDIFHKLISCLSSCAFSARMVP